MPIRLREIYVDLDDTLEDVKAAAAKTLGVPADRFVSFRPVRKAIDARRKPRIKFVYTVEIALASLDDERAAMERAPPNTARATEPPTPRDMTPGGEDLDGPVVIVGAGPSGLMAALRLAENGYAPLVIERGHEVDRRDDDVGRFLSGGELSPESNIVFGEGGAGTYSDGKLTHRCDSPAAARVLATLAECGAGDDVTVDAKPHVGSDVLPRVTAQLRRKIEASGGRFMYGVRAEQFEIVDGRLTRFVAQGEDGTEEVRPGAVVIAPGSSGRDTWRGLRKSGVALEARPTLIGVRVEHPQEVIDRAQYGDAAGHPALGAAEYFVARKEVCKLSPVHSFCMCPGGIVIPVASVPGRLSTNGMSRRARDSGYANAALITPVTPGEYGGAGPLAGVVFLEELERVAFELGGCDYSLPFQRLVDFSQGRPSRSLPDSPAGTRRRGANLSGRLPKKAERSIIQALRDFAGKIRGFMSKRAGVYGFELRTGSPVRIVREKEGMSVSATNLYPAGEGAGYAGGIVSSAVDGLRQARRVINRYKRPTD